MNTGGSGRRLATVLGVIAVCMVVVCSVAGLVVWRLVGSDSGRALSVPFPTAGLQAAAAPFRSQVGKCEIEQVGYARSGSTVTTCEPGAGAPGPIVFTEYQTPTDLIPASAAQTSRCGGRATAVSSGPATTASTGATTSSA